MNENGCCHLAQYTSVRSNNSYLSYVMQTSKL